VTNWLRSISGRATYAAVLWVLAFSTLEQFEGLNRDLFGLRSLMFHSLTCSIALAAALFEAVTLRGVSGLRDLWDRPDPIAGIANRSCTYRAALSGDLLSVRKLAIKRYGWAFPMKALQRWHQANPKCLFLMLSEGELVGYVDAFPISGPDYEHLLAGGEERLITPLREDAVEPTCSFYIASVVIAEGWGGRLPALLNCAIKSYSGYYPQKAWCRVCAIGYSPGGRTLLEKKEMQPVVRDNVKIQMYTIDRRTLLSRKANRALWQKLLPDPPRRLE
jgi:hypothetical protein